MENSNTQLASESPKVSVIVPVYNVEQYIEKCAESLFSQTLDDLEILFIDDCSPDSSVELIENTLKKYPSRVDLTRIIRRTANGGQAAVRRQGIIEARGDYVIHCDGDDWVDEDLYEKMYLKAVEDNADIVVCDEINEYAAYQELRIQKSLPKESRDVIKNWYKYVIGMFCHNKLVRRNLYIDNDIYPWDGLNMWEDNGLLTRVFYYGKQVSQIHGTYYHYNRANISSMTASYGDNQIRQMIGIAENLTQFFRSKDDYEEFEKTVSAFQFLAKINYINDKWSGIRKYKNTFPGAERIAKELDTYAFSKKGLVRFYMVKFYIPWLFVILFKLYNLKNKR